ncbi:hypothetical protein PENTCL1PPCAC_7601, partial [Pristionchus entomophagus]
ASTALLLLLLLALNVVDAAGNATAYKCYDSDIKDTPPADTKTCTGTMCKLEVQYSGFKLTDLKSMTGSCITSDEEGCWTYRSEHRTVCHCHADQCNSKTNQNRAINNAVNHAGHTSGRGMWLMAAAVPLLIACFH